MQDLEQLNRDFGSGDASALLDALALCRRHSLAVPGWVFDALLAKRDAVVTALKPPTQRIETTGFDTARWGGIDADRGIEQVAAGKGVKIVAGRTRQANLRLELQLRDAQVVTLYRALAMTTPRQSLVTKTCIEAKRLGINLSRAQVSRIVKCAHRRLR